MRLRTRRIDDDQALRLTPLIDIVFLLLIFFVTTFKIVPFEGDFPVHLPQANAAVVADLEKVSILLKVTMTSGPAGNLAGISLDGRKLEPTRPGENVFDVLRREVRAMSGDGVELAVEFECDRQLGYRYLIQGITAVSESVDGDNLVEQIRITSQPRD